MIIIGERLNSTRATVTRAIEQKDVNFIQRQAAIQAEAGADYIDVNAGTFLENEAALLKWMVEVVQEVVDKPLCLDSAEPQTIAAALEVHKGKALLNSTTGQKQRYDSILPILKEHDCGIVALCLDDSGIPTTVEERLQIAANLIASLTKEGISLSDIYIDPVIQPISVELTSAMVALQLIREIREQYPEVHIISGVSNVSFGLPARSCLNRAFLLMAMAAGLDAAIVDPCDQELMTTLLAADALLARDEYCMNYINAYRKGKPS